jgi:type IV pilus assembly protein PilA
MSMRKIRQRAARSGVEGFTLIELLIVVVIIGILAAIAIPQFSDTKEQAQVAKMKSDLRNLITAQEAYFVGNDTYTATLGDLTDFNPSQGVTVTINSATASGWDATASHGSVTDDCAVAIGDGTNAVDGTANPGEVVCGSTGA